MVGFFIVACIAMLKQGHTQQLQGCPFCSHEHVAPTITCQPWCVQRGFCCQVRKFIIANSFLPLGILLFTFLGHTPKSVRAFKRLSEILVVVCFSGKCIISKMRLFRREPYIVLCKPIASARSNLLHIFLTSTHMHWALSISCTQANSL